jgi:PAS domain S-box-containing protein
MTIARKLWLGFGALILIFLLAGLIIGTSVRALDDLLEEIVEVEEPVDAASYEMEINTVELGRDVRSYLFDDDPKYREWFENDRGEFEEAHSLYEELADSARERELGGQLDSLHEEYVALGKTLMDEKDQQDTTLALIEDNFLRLEKAADTDVRWQEPNRSEKALLWAKLEANVAEVEGYRQSYLQAPEERYLDLFDGEVSEVRADLARFNELGPTAAEQARISELEELFDQNVALSEEAIAASDSMREDLNRFSGLQTEMDNLLDEEVQAGSHQRLVKARAIREEEISDVYGTILATLAVGLLVGALAAYLISRGIIGSVRKLREGAEKIGRGELDHRIGLNTSDELGTLATTFNDMLDRRREANVALRESEERFRGLSDATFEGIAISENGRVLETNRAFAELFGYERSEVVGMNVLDFVASESHELVRRNISSLSREPYEAIGLKKDATTFDVEVHGKTSSHRNHIVRVTAIRDITERKEAERRLREAEERYRTLVENAPAVVYIDRMDEVSSALYMSPQAEEMFGYPVDEWLTDPELFVKLLHPEDKEAVLAEHLRTDATGEKFDMEYRLIARDGRVVWVRDESVIIQDEEEPFRQGILLDITERKEAERKYREAETRYQTLIENIPAVTYIQQISEPSVTTYVSPQMKNMLGYEPEECTSDPEHWVKLLHPDDKERVQAEDERTNETGEPFRTEYRQFAKDGRVVWVRDEAMLVRDEEGNPLYWQGVQFDITERKRAEESLRESEASLAEAQRIANLGSWEWDVRTGEVRWSDEVFRIYGYEPGEFVPTLERLLEIVHPDDRELLRKRIDAALYEGAPYDFNHRVVLPSGEERKVNRRAEVVRDEEGEPLCMVGTVQDITERQRAEEEIRRLNAELEDRVRRRTAQLEATVSELRENERRLRESEERYSLVVEGSNDGIFDWDIRTGKLFWNDRLFEMLDLSHSEFTSTLEDFFELLHAEDRERVSENLTAHLERGAEYNVELRLRHSSGEYVHCIGRGKAQREEDGTPYRMAGTVTDITERKRTEEAQRFLSETSAALSSSLDYRATLASVARLAVPPLADWCAVDVVEEDGSLKRLAVEHEDPEKASLARELQGRYPPDLDALYGVAKVLRTGKPELVPEIPETLLEEAIPDGELRGVVRGLGLRSLMVVPLMARGRTLGAITLVTAESGRRYGDEDLALAEELARRAALAVDNARLYDEARKELAERKRVEEEIRRLNETLERRVEERTAQLEAAMKAADEANRAKSEFLANMSHEIRTPMNGVIGMTELLLDAGLDREQREYAEAIRLSGENLMVIINDILDFSKIEAGAMRLETIDFDLRSAIEDVVDLLASRAHDKGLELASLIEYDVPAALRGDPGRLRQVLTNLVGNAIKFTEEGEVVVKVALAEERSGSEDGAMIRFEIRDTGIGMTPEQQERLFRSFTQADASTTRRYGGTGLGLAISKQLIEMMGGEIGAESEPGAGSTFFFTVPFEEQPAEAVATPRPPADLGGLRALVVDDNETNRKILRDQLSSWGVESGEAENGPGALEALRSAAQSGESYDLAILDMQMPAMPGMELAERINADPAISATRLVLLTSVGQRGEGEEARRAGIEAYLTKPVRQSELYDALATVMGEEEAPEEEASLITRHTLRERRAVGRARVLVAEDNPVNQKVAARMLENLGYRVDVARDGLEALEALSKTHYGAVLMDVQMPEMDGYQATEEIRRREAEVAGHRTPIIAMTANALEGDREKALEAGMDDYLSKPVKPEQLAAILERWVPREPSQAEGALPPPNGEGPDGNGEGSEGPLDEGVLAGLRELGDAELISELAGMFLDDASSRLTDLRGAVEAGDAPAVERVAHTLKGSSGNMGAARMAAICAELQVACASGDLGRAPELLARLEEEFGRVRPALEAEVARSRRS